MKRISQVLPYFYLLFWGTMLAFALLLSKERMFLDASYYLFHLLNRASFVIEHQRISLFFSQILPVLGIKLGFSTQWIIGLFSVNQVFFFAFLFYVMRYQLKDLASAHALLLLSVCGVAFLYFCPMYEVWYGCAGLIVYQSMIKQQLFETTKGLILTVVVALLCLFSYPVIFLGVIFYTFYHLDFKKNFRFFLLIGFLVGIYFVAKQLMLTDYERAKMNMQAIGFSEFLTRFFHSAYLKQLFLFQLSVYGELWAGAIALFCLPIFQQNRNFRLLLPFCFSLFLLLFVNFYHNSEAAVHTNYYERMYLMMATVGCIALAEFAELSSKKPLLYLGLLAILIFRFMLILEHSHFYTHRIQSIEKMVDKAISLHQIKSYTDIQLWDKDDCMDEWSTPMEALIYSSSKGLPLTISFQKDFDFTQIKDSCSIRLRLDEFLSNKELNQHYFAMPCVSYKALK